MSDNEDKSITDAPEADDSQRIEGDAALNLLVHLAEQGAASQVTVYTSGTAFTGILISMREYFNLCKDQFGSTPAGIMFNEFLSHLPDEPDNGPAPDYRFLHLREGQVITPGQGGMPAEGVPLRIMRDSIVGWSIGQLKASRT